MYRLSDYLNRSIERAISMSLRLSLESAGERDFIRRSIVFQRAASEKRHRAEERGDHIPLFLIASISSACNLFCAGCYSRANNACRPVHPADRTDQLTVLSGHCPADRADEPASGSDDLSAARWGDLFKEAADLGIGLIVLAGGEPLLRKDVIEKAALVPEIIFPLFTNATLIDEDWMSFFDRFRHIVPVISLEGDAEETDARRGEGVYEVLRRQMGLFKKAHLLYGVSVTVTSANMDFVTSPAFIKDLRLQGCRLLFYIEYTPVDRSAALLTLDDRQRKRLSEIISGLRRTETRMIFSSFPGDEAETGGCLAAGRGFFHISAAGNAEPCPVSPYSDISVRDKSLRDAIHSAFFKSLREDGFLAADHDGGCLLLDKEKEVADKLKKAAETDPARLF